MTVNALRKKLACEAASLLYSGMEKEFKQAKLKAARSLNLRFLPSNAEVAEELDRIAEQSEGFHRQERLVQMRREALRLMRILKTHYPLLVGSVWRGTIHRNSDIDVVVYHDEPADVLLILRQNDVRILHAGWVAVTKKGMRKDSFHINAELKNSEEAEIKICNVEEARSRQRCEIYGDEIIGLDLDALESLLERSPLQRFVPF